MKKLLAALVVIVLFFVALVAGAVTIFSALVTGIVQDTVRYTNASCVARAEGLSTPVDLPGGGTPDASPAPGVPHVYEDAVAAAAEESGLPPAIIAAQIDKESGWDPKVTNPSSGAAGIAQFMPGTWAQYGEGDPLDGQDSIAAQGRYMGVLMDLAEPHADDDAEQIKLALAAYNWGPGNMEGNGWKLTGLPTETSNYIATITSTGQAWYTTDCAPAADFQNIGDLGDGEWTSPLPGGQFSSAGAYGPRNIPGYPAWANNHAGIDLMTPGGNGKVVAPTDLRITGIYGTDGCVMAKATEGPDFGMAFCHMDRIDVATGDKVDRGTDLGLEGGTAGSLGGRSVVHLHFELYHPDSPDPTHPGHGNTGIIDPTPILRAKGAIR